MACYWNLQVWKLAMRKQTLKSMIKFVSIANITTLMEFTFICIPLSHSSKQEVGLCGNIDTFGGDASSTKDGFCTITSTWLQKCSDWTH